MDNAGAFYADELRRISRPRWRLEAIEEPGRLRRGAVMRRAAPHIATMAKVTVWHDGACPLCRAEIALMRRLDRRGAIAFVDVSAPGQRQCPVDRAQLLARLHASENGILLSGAAAFAAMWRAIPVLRPLGLLARSSVTLAILERGYTAFLKVRPSLQRLVRRVVPG